MTRAALAALVVSMAGLAACSPTKEPAPGIPAANQSRPGPPYAEAAAKYNANASRLSRLFAPVTVRIRYSDKDGKEHNEQGEGRLQIIQPDHVALNIGKVGEIFFWLGADSQRYWWIDLSGKPRAMFVGVHGNYEKSQARRVGVVVAPLDLVRLLGVVPVPQTGQTQLSADGKRIGIVTQLEGGGRQRIWVDPATYVPASIELYNAADECEILAQLRDPEGVELQGTAFKPLMSKHVEITHQASGSLITLDLSEMQDGIGRMVPDAFDPEVLVKQLRVDKIYDLDAPPLPPKAPVTPAP